MKRLLAALGVFAFFGFVLGKVSARPKATEAVEHPVQPTIVHVHAQPLEDKPLEGKWQAPRRWIATYRDILDPFSILMVALAAAVATGYFAKQTNAITSDQRALMERQIDIQQSQSLPLFTVNDTYVWDGEGQPIQHWLMLSNTGGLARNVTLEIDIALTLVFGKGADRNVYVTYIPVDGYADASPEYIPELSEAPAQLGQWGNALRLRTDVDKVLETLNQRTSLRYKSGSVDWGITINYQDYQGNSRVEHYLYEQSRLDWEGTMIDPLHHGGSGELVALSSEDAEGRSLRIEVNRDDGLVVDGRTSPQDFVDVLLGEIDIQTVPQSTPVATPLPNLDVQPVLDSKLCDIPWSFSRIC